MKTNLKKQLPLATLLIALGSMPMTYFIGFNNGVCSVDTKGIYKFAQMNALYRSQVHYDENGKYIGPVIEGEDCCGH